MKSPLGLGKYHKSFYDTGKEALYGIGASKLYGWSSSMINSAPVLTNSTKQFFNFTTGTLQPVILSPDSPITP